MRYPKILEEIKKNNTPPSTIGVFGHFLVWLPAFGLLPEDSLVLDFMKVGFLGLIFLSLYAWLFGLERRKTRALVYVGVLVVAFFLTVMIFYVRIIEHFYSTFHQPVGVVFLNTALITLVSARWFIEIYRSHQTRLRALRQRGLLKHYQILDEEQGFFRMPGEFPGLDGSSPDKEMEKQFARWRWLDILPIGGITFFLLRTVSGSIGWIMLLVCAWIYIGFFPFFIKMLVLWIELWIWERELSKKIYIPGKDEHQQ